MIRVPAVGRVSEVAPVVAKARVLVPEPRVMLPVVPDPKVKLLAMESWVPAPVRVLEAVETAKVNPAPIFKVFVPFAVMARLFTVAKEAAPVVPTDQAVPPVRARVVEALLLPMVIISAAVPFVAILIVSAAELSFPPISVVLVMVLSPILTPPVPEVMTIPEEPVVLPTVIVAAVVVPILIDPLVDVPVPAFKTKFPPIEVVPDSFPAFKVRAAPVPEIVELLPG